MSTMPPKKRTNHSKRTPPASPTTSTSHTSADHHHLRHTGPSIATRAGVGATPSKPPPAQPKHTPEGTPTLEGPEAEKKPADVPAPGGRTPLFRFMYNVIMLSVMLSLIVWYVYYGMALLEKLKEGAVAGEPGRTARWEAFKGWGFGADWVGWLSGPGRSQRGDLEGLLDALADALGISPVQVASAVKSLIPEASLSSIASKATGRSEAVRILYEDTTRYGRDKADFWSVTEGFAERMEKGPDEEKIAEGIA